MPETTVYSEIGEMKNLNSMLRLALISGSVSGSRHQWKSILPQWNTGQVLFFKWNEYRILDYGKRLSHCKNKPSFWLKTGYLGPY